MRAAKVDHDAERAALTVLDVVVVASGDGDLALDCVDSLREQGVSAERVALVDNASPEPLADRARERFPAAEVVRLESSDGYSSACNAGARAGSGELVLFLNDDIMATEGAVARLVEALLANPGAVAAGGRLVDPDDGTTQLQYKPKRFPTLASLTVLLVGLAKLWPSNPVTRRHSGQSLDDRSTVPVDQPAGACLVIRRSELEALGGWDEGYWFWYEDVDLAKRLNERGDVLYVPAAAFRHVGGASFERWDRAGVVRTRFTGMLRYAAQHLSGPRRAGLAAVIVLVSLPRVIWFSLFRPEVGRAWRAVIRATPPMVRSRPPGKLR